MFGRSRFYKYPAYTTAAYPTAYPATTVTSVPTTTTTSISTAAVPTSKLRLRERRQLKKWIKRAYGPQKITSTHLGLAGFLRGLVSVAALTAFAAWLWNKMRRQRKVAPRVAPAPVPVRSRFFIKRKPVVAAPVAAVPAGPGLRKGVPVRTRLRHIFRRPVASQTIASDVYY